MEVRPIQRDGFCRCCDRAVHKGELIFYTYSRRNRGQSIIICIQCSEKIGDMFNNHIEGLV